MHREKRGHHLRKAAKVSSYTEGLAGDKFPWQGRLKRTASLLRRVWIPSVARNYMAPTCPPTISCAMPTCTTTRKQRHVPSIRDARWLPAKDSQIGCLDPKTMHGQGTTWLSTDRAHTHTQSWKPSETRRCAEPSGQEGSATPARRYNPSDKDRRDTQALLARPHPHPLNRGPAMTWNCATNAARSFASLAEWRERSHNLRSE